MAKSTPKTLGNYAVEGEIGRGGMGVVMLGRQKGLERAAVLKKLRDDLASGPEFVERFRREARAAAEVHHQNVVAVYDCFSHRGDQYIAQEYVDGIDLRGALEKARCVPPEIAARIAVEIIRGLEAIHLSGTVHRDLKPANILLGRLGEVKIADFGIALDPSEPKLTQPGIMIGTPPYMPPEQMLGARVDHRGDLFSFGILCYEMVAGTPPYPGPQDDEAETLLGRMEKERYRPLRKRVPGAPRYYARLVRTCLRPRPNQRGGSAAEIRRKLERKILYSSSADCRGEIAAWLWEEDILAEPLDSGVSTAVSHARVRRRVWLSRAAVAATVVAVAISTFLVVRATPRVEPPWYMRLLPPAISGVPVPPPYAPQSALQWARGSGNAVR